MNGKTVERLVKGGIMLATTAVGAILASCVKADPAEEVIDQAVPGIEVEAEEIKVEEDPAE